MLKTATSLRRLFAFLIVDECYRGFSPTIAADGRMPPCTTPCKPSTASVFSRPVRAGLLRRSKARAYVSILHFWNTTGEAILCGFCRIFGWFFAVFGAIGVLMYL